MLKHLDSNTHTLANDKNSKYVVVGRLGRPYGLKGWQHLQTFTQPPENIFEYKGWYVLHKKLWQPVKLAEYKLHGSTWIIHLEGINTKEEAALYSNFSIAVLRNELPRLEEGEYYWSDLEGLSVFTKEGLSLGKIEYLYENTGQDIMAVKSALPGQQSKERHIPFIWEETVLEVDIIENKVIVDWAFDIV